nr:Na(+)/H(+) antiporter subunit D [Oceanococcus sp. HetDA_MAG_MS8]
MIEGLLHPAVLLYLAAGMLWLLPLALGRLLAVAAPLLALAALWSLDGPTALQLGALNWDWYRADKLALIFGTIFLIAGNLGLLYAWPENNRRVFSAGLAYCGSAVGATLAADLPSLFMFWEFTALASLPLLVHRHPDYGLSISALIRYFAIQILSGVLLLFGLLARHQAGLDLGFNHLGLDSPGGLLILLAFGIKAAFPLLHNWVQDAYPRSGPAGTVLLSTFTTKLAIYALIRSYAGTDILIPIGAVMTLFPIFFAVLENDLRRVLAYSLNNQLGFMVVGVGIGTPLALDGAAAHAFCHILYKSLLFMSMGAVLYRVGTTRATDLGGLYSSMPWTARFCIIGAMSISALPLLSGFVSKSMILAAAVYEGHPLVWLILLFASAGVLDHSGIKVPFFAFFAHDGGHRVQEAPWPMLLAMGITALACIVVGIAPALLYALLPLQDYKFIPYTADHVVTQMQLLLFAGLAFVWLYRSGRYPAEIRALHLDSDVLYRRWAPQLTQRLDNIFSSWGQRAGAWCADYAALALRELRNLTNDKGLMGGTPAVGVMAATFLLLAAVVGALLL